jgi:hypothetical protein
MFRRSNWSKPANMFIQHTRKPKRWLIRLAAHFVVDDPRYKETGYLHSDGKIELFYKSIAIVLALIAAIIAIMGGITLAHAGGAMSMGPLNC